MKFVKIAPPMTCGREIIVFMLGNSAGRLNFGSVIDYRSISETDFQR